MMEAGKGAGIRQKLHLSPNAKNNLKIIVAFVLSLALLVSFLYALMVIWIPSWFPPPQDNPTFDLSLFTYTDAEQTTAGEPINLVVLADSGEQIVQEFEKTGLIRVLSVDQQSVGTTIKDAVEEMVTPISKRYLFGREQDYAFQSHSDSVAHRHHIRIWRYEDYTWNGKPVWLVSASYDKGLGLSLSGLLPIPTHIVSPNIDDERDFFADLLVKHSLVSGRHHVAGVGPILFRSNGDLSFYYTDGEIVVLDLGKAASSQPEIEPWYWSMMVRQRYFDVPTFILQFLGVAQVYGTADTALMTIENVIR